MVLHEGDIKVKAQACGAGTDMLGFLVVHLPVFNSKGLNPDTLYKPQTLNPQSPKP